MAKKTIKAKPVSGRSAALRGPPLPDRKWQPTVVIRGRYDAAQTTDNNSRHWAGADALSADLANKPFVRATLRNRARYEVANNGWAKGIVLTLANDLVGPGPRLQLRTDDEALNREIERQFTIWSKRVRLGAKLRTLQMSKTVDGEGIALLIDNPRLAHAVHLDLRLVESEQLTAPSRYVGRENMIDGVELDAADNPVRYWILKSHPGGTYMRLDDFEQLEPADVIHWFRADRPGQHRGVPDLTPALEAFGQLRRYRLAVLDAAETAANIAGVLETEMPPADSDGERTADELPPQAVFDLERNAFLTTPMGWRLKQVAAEQPATTHTEFVESIINEVARPLNMPFSIAACNSSKYNYASGRLDHQGYWKSLEVERDDLEQVALESILAAWLVEAARAIPAAQTLMALLKDGGEVPHQWFWRGREHVDPTKEADAQATRLTNNTTTLAAEYAREGKDWETELEQRSKERARMVELGIPLAETLVPGTNPARQNNQGEQNADN